MKYFKVLAVAGLTMLTFAALAQTGHHRFHHNFRHVHHVRHHRPFQRNPG